MSKKTTAPGQDPVQYVRKNGYYWVRLFDEHWDVAEWNNVRGYWELAGIKNGFYDAEFCFISDEPIKTPDDGNSNETVK